jgi:hypothetical protein
LRSRLANRVQLTIVALIDAATPAPAKRGPYKKRKRAQA